MTTRRIYLGVILTMLITLIVLSCVPLPAQTFKVENPLAFKSDTIADIIVQGVTVRVHVTADGNHYMEAVSARTKETYKVYYGFKTKYKYSAGAMIKNETVYSNRLGTEYWGLVFTRNNTLKKLPLAIE